MRRYLKLLTLFIRVSIQNDAAYRVDFFLRSLTALFQLGGELIMLWTIFSNTRSLAGWSAAQVIVLLGVFRIMAGLIGLMIAPNMRRIMEDIRQGTLDFVLIKPINAQFYASVRQVVFWRVIDLAIGLCLAMTGVIGLSRTLSAGEIGLFVLLLACGAMIIYSLWLILATSVFWFTRIDNIEMLFWNLFEAGRYPIDIYHPWVRWLLTFVLPVAFLITIPAGALVARIGSLEALAACVAAPLALVTASLFWRVGLRRYSGASA